MSLFLNDFSLFFFPSSLFRFFLVLWFCLGILDLRLCRPCNDQRQHYRPVRNPPLSDLCAKDRAKPDCSTVSAQGSV